jgi:hypothetical protein
MVAAISFLVLPVAVDLALSDERRAIGYVAADFFYYGVVAEHIATSGLPSFDGEHATNGFHPLWQLVLGGARWLTLKAGAPRTSLLPMSIWIGLILMAGGIAALCLAMRRREEGLSALAAILPVGIYALLLSPFWWGWYGTRMEEFYRADEGALPLYGTLWSYLNGMESALLVFCFGITAYWYTTREVLARPRYAFILGLLLAAIALARLDHVFFSMAILGLLAARFQRLTRNQRRALALALAAFAIPLAIYMVWNMVAFGNPVPMSGRMKSSFPSSKWTNLRFTLDLLVGDAGQPADYHRALQMWLPLGLAAVYVLATAVAAWRHRRRSGAVELAPALPPHTYQEVLFALAVNTLLLGLYNLLFVPWNVQGHWYYPLSVVFVSLLLIRAVQNARPLRWLEQTPWRVSIWIGVCGLIGATYFLMLQRQPEYHSAYARFLYDEAPRLRAFYRQQHVTPRLVENDDGIVAFATGFPTLSGPAPGLVLDREGYEALLRGELGKLALARGHNRLTSLYYFHLAAFEEGPYWFGELQRWWQISEPERYRYRVEYSVPELRFGILTVSDPADEGSEEILDAGDDPTTRGCQRVHLATAIPCTSAVEEWGDYCVDARGKLDRTNTSPFLKERVASRSGCTLGVPANKLYDCRQVLGNAQARCRWAGKAICPLGNRTYGSDSAACELPPSPPAVLPARQQR